MVETAVVGHEANYVIDDDGFKRHIDAEIIDRQVLGFFLQQLEDNKEMAVEQALNMMGTDDIFAKAALDAELRNIDMEKIIAQGIPEQARNMLGIGAEAREMVGRTPADIVAIRPLRDGVISEFEITESMLKYFIDKAHEQMIVPFPRPRVVVGIPSGVTEVEKRAVYEVFEHGFGDFKFGDNAIA